MAPIEHPAWCERKLCTAPPARPAAMNPSARERERRIAASAVMTGQLDRDWDICRTCGRYLFADPWGCPNDCRIPDWQLEFLGRRG